VISVLTIFGTRPEAIKLAPVLYEFACRKDVFRSCVCVTGQHRATLDQMLRLFVITPDYDLQVMRRDQSPADVTLAVLDGVQRVLEAERPDWVVVQGDTTTTMAGSLGAFHHRCRVAHVEAGLRTFDTSDPWPEEVNRRVTGVVADLHFAPTVNSARNLYREGIPEPNVYVTGNTVVDALRMIAALPFDPSATPLAPIVADQRLIIVATVHRREKSPAEVAEISAALRGVARLHPEVLIVCPLHPNRRFARQLGGAFSGVDNVVVLPPLDYQPMVWLLRRCHFVVTDSGGLQEEAAELGRPTLVVRKSTERVESLAAGTAAIIGTDRRGIEAWARRLLCEPETYDRMARPVRAYGDGTAARTIVDVLVERSRV
jgi:UDP-N-acetylglucosamine 2-epimerase (non-hydrolysing)